MTEPPPLPPYLREGVRFGCTHCGACCSGAPGRVRLRTGELERIAAFLGRDLVQVREELTRRDPAEGAELLREEANGDCVFFREGRCAVQPVKPAQCRLYPFWFRNVRSREAWDKTIADCPGIGQGDWIPPEEILQQIGEDHPFA
jgi:Fe-S-cluster containining protein